MVSKNAQSGLHTCGALEKNPYFSLNAPVIRKRDQLPPFLLRFSQNIKFFFTYSVVTVYHDFKSPVLNERVEVAHKTEFYSYESLYEPILTKAETN